MSHYAEVKNGIVVRVITAEADFIAAIPGKWVQTSYNTRGGVHSLGGVPLRKNYAGVGYTYDAVRDAFIPPMPANATGLNESTCLWNVPIPPAIK